MTLRESFDKILRGERLLEEERLNFLDWVQRAENLSIGVNPVTGQITVLNTGPTQPEIQAMVDSALLGRQLIPKLSDISDQSGILIAGEFRSGNGKVPGDGFTGGRYGWPGFTYGGTTYFLAGVQNDVLQVGLSLADGKVYAGEGAVILDGSGITANLGSIGGWHITSETIGDEAGQVGLSSQVTGGNDVRIWAGSNNQTTAPFRVYESGGFFASDATISGSITATSGTIGGWSVASSYLRKLSGTVGIVLDSSTPKIQVGDTNGVHIVIDGANQRIRSSNFVAGQVGSNWDTATGDAEFNNITARGELKTFLFTASNQMAVAGNIIVSKDAGKLGANVSSVATTVNFGKALTVGDWIKIQGPDDAGSNNLEWMLVGSLVSGTTYNVTRNVDGSGANGWLKDTPFVVIGASGDSRIELVAGASGSIQLITQGAAWNTQTVQASMSTVAGAITAAGGSVNIDSTGITTDNNYPGVSFLATNPLKTAYLKMSNTDDFIIRNSVASRLISLTIDLADASTPAVQWSEDSNNANVSLLTVNASPTAPTRVTIGGTQAANVGIDLWANSDGKTTVFNDNSYDVDFRIEGSTEANMLFIDAGNNRVGIGTNIPAAAFSAEGGVIFNDFGADVDTRIEGDTDSNLFFLDASLDAIGIGGAAVSGQKVTIYGGFHANEAGTDTDSHVEGDTDANLTVWDAGLDAVGMGGAAESGYKLKVTGDMRVTGKVVNGTLGGKMYLPFVTYQVVSPLAANGAPFNSGIDRTVTFVTWSQSVYVATTNDGSNYWTIELRRVSDDSVINSINTSAISANTWTLLTDSTFSISSVGTSDIGTYIYCTKTNAPGNLSILGPSVEVSI